MSVVVLPTVSLYIAVELASRSNKTLLNAPPARSFVLSFRPVRPVLSALIVSHSVIFVIRILSFPSRAAP